MLCGIGLRFTRDPTVPSRFVVLVVLPNGSAARHGQIMPGDRLIEVDGVDVFNFSHSELSDLVRGQEGTQVNLVMERNHTFMSVSLVRSFISDDHDVQRSHAGAPQEYPNQNSGPPVGHFEFQFHQPQHFQEFDPHTAAVPYAPYDGVGSIDSSNFGLAISPKRQMGHARVYVPTQLNALPVLIPDGPSHGWGWTLSDILPKEPPLLPLPDLVGEVASSPLRAAPALSNNDMVTATVAYGNSPPPRSARKKEIWSPLGEKMLVDDDDVIDTAYSTQLQSKWVNGFRKSDLTTKVLPQDDITMNPMPLAMGEATDTFHPRPVPPIYSANPYSAPLQYSPPTTALGTPKRPAMYSVRNASPQNQKMSPVAPFRSPPKPLPVKEEPAAFSTLLVRRSGPTGRWYTYATLTDLRGQPEGFLSELFRTLSWGSVAVFALFLTLKISTISADLDLWASRVFFEQVRTSWWRVFSPLFFADALFLLTVPSFVSTCYDFGFYIACRYYSQRSGYLSSAIVGNFSMLAAELLFVADLEGVGITKSKAVLYLIPLFSGFVIAILFSLAGIFLARKPSTAFGVLSVCVCTLGWLVLLALRIDGHIKWNYAVVFAPLWAGMLCWVIVSYAACVKSTRDLVNKTMRKEFARRHQPGVVTICAWVPNSLAPASTMMIASMGLAATSVMVGLLLERRYGLNGRALNTLPDSLIPLYCIGAIMAVWQACSWASTAIGAISKFTGLDRFLVLEDLEISKPNPTVEDVAPMRLAVDKRGQGVRVRREMDLVELPVDDIFEWEGNHSFLWRSLTYALLGLFAVIIILLYDSDTALKDYPTKTFFRDLRANPWYWLAPLWFIDILFAVAAVRLLVTWYFHGVFHALRRFSQRSGFMAATAFGNTFFFVSRLLYCAMLHEPVGVKHLRYTIVVVPLLVGFLLQLVTGLVGLAVGRGLGAAGVWHTLMGSAWICFLSLIALRIDGAISTSWYIIFVPFWWWVIAAIIFLFAIWTRHVVNFEEGFSRTSVMLFLCVCLLAQSIFIPIAAQGAVSWTAQEIVIPTLFLGCFHVFWFLIGSFTFRPSSPTNFVCTIDGFAASISWSPAPNILTVWTPMTYILDFKKGRVGPWRRVCVTSTTRAHCPGLDKGQLYIFRVRSIALTGHRARDLVSTPVTTPFAVPSRILLPPLVKNFVRFYRSGRPLTLPHEYHQTYAAVIEWKGVEEEAEYCLEASAMLTDESSWTTVYQGPQTQARMLHLLPSTTFRIRVCATNFVGKGESSPVSLFTTPHMDIPQGPQSSTARGQMHIEGQNYPSIYSEEGGDQVHDFPLLANNTDALPVATHPQTLVAAPSYGNSSVPLLTMPAAQVPPPPPPPLPPGAVPLPGLAPPNIIGQISAAMPQPLNAQVPAGQGATSPSTSIQLPPTVLSPQQASPPLPPPPSTFSNQQPPH